MGEFRLTYDFHINKRIIDDISVIQSKRLRNKIAGNECSRLLLVGFTTHLMKRIQKGPVRGISLKLQEEVSFYPTYSIAINFIIIGKRKKDGLYSRIIRTLGC